MNINFRKKGTSRQNHQATCKTQRPTYTVRDRRRSVLLWKARNHGARPARLADGEPPPRSAQSPRRRAPGAGWPHTGLPSEAARPRRCPHRLDRLSGRGTHLVRTARHSTGASKRLSVVTLRMRRYTCNRQGCWRPHAGPGGAPHTPQSRGRVHTWT